MNDPKVVALIYAVEHGNSVSYDNAAPFHYGESPDFDLTVSNKIVRFEFKKHYSDEDGARQAIEPFIERWEFEADLLGGTNGFRLRYMNPEIVDLNPSPPEPGIRGIRIGPIVGGPSSVEVGVAVLRTEYPPPPLSRSVDTDDSAVVKMKRRYDQYCLRRATLPDVAYFCVSVLEEKYGGREAAAKECRVSKRVIRKIAMLASEKGGEDARKAKGADDDFTVREKQFLREAIAAIIRRVAQVAADDSQCLTQITMTDLPSL